MTGQISAELLLLYAGLILWTIGYDTIYACQDVEDDAMIGVKSTARLFAHNTKMWVGIIYALCFALVAIATPFTPIAFICILPFGLHLLWQTLTLDYLNAVHCLQMFKSNRTAALLLVAGFVLAKML